MKDQNKIAIRHFMLSENFLQLVENTLTEAVSHGNISTYFGPPIDNIREHYRVMTKWSDFRILVPTLFNFFHGIELLLKAANYKFEPPSKRPTHNLDNLFSKFKINYPSAVVLITILTKYVYPDEKDSSILKKFYTSNNIADSRQAHEVFRFPYFNDFQIDINYVELRNLDSEGIDFFKQIIKDIQIIQKEIGGL